MNSLDLGYQELLIDILENGTVKKDRTGTGTISVFNRQIRHKMADGFPLLTTKKMAFKAMGTELKWFINGDTNIKYLLDNNCGIWTGDAYKKYRTAIGNAEELSMADFVAQIKCDKNFAAKWGQLGPIYGRQWRAWTTVAYEEGVAITKTIDQFAGLLKDLRTNPDSRRLIVNSWNVGEIDSMTLPPCHYSFQCWTRELTFEERFDLQINRYDYQSYYTEEELDKNGIPKRAISLAWNQRSVDTLLGLPFNIASYGLLLTLLGKEVNMVPEDLIGNLADTHLYLNHIEQAKEQALRTSFKLPKLEINVPDGKNFSIYDFEPSHIKLVNYISHEKIAAPLSN